MAVILGGESAVALDLMLEICDEYRILHGLEPIARKNILIDGAKGFRNSMSLLQDADKVAMCNYHYTAAIGQKAKDYLGKWGGRSFVMNCARALAYVPPDSVERAWGYIKTELEKRSLVDNAWNELIEYMETEFVQIIGGCGYLGIGGHVPSIPP